MVSWRRKRQEWTMGARHLIRITCCLGGLYLIPREAVASSYDEATRKLLLATYKYSDLDDYAKRLEREYIPESVRKHGGFIAAGAVACIDKRFVYRWSFP